MTYKSVKFSEMKDDESGYEEYAIWYYSNLTVYSGDNHVVLYYNDAEKTYIDMYGPLHASAAYDKYLRQKIEIREGSKDNVQIVPVSEFHFWVYSKQQRMIQQHIVGVAGEAGTVSFDTLSDPEYDAGDPT